MNVDFYVYTTLIVAIAICIVIAIITYPRRG